MTYIRREMEADFSKLKCDNPECNYVAPEGLHKWGEHLIGTPCPLCNANLLTAEDFETADTMIDTLTDPEFVEKLDKMSSSPEGRLLEAILNDKFVRVNVHKGVTLEISDAPPMKQRH